MSIRSSRTVFRRWVLMATLIAGVLLVVAPASAGNGRHHGGHHRGGYYRGPAVGVFVGLPPIAFHFGPRHAGYYAPAPPYYDEYGYEHGYEDGYDERAREEWRRGHYRRHHHHHDDCDY